MQFFPRKGALCVLTLLAAAIPAACSRADQLTYSVFDLGALGSSNSIYDSRPWSVNDRGWSTGNSHVPGTTAFHAFLHDGIAMRDLGLMGGSDSHGRDINKNGWVVGAMAKGAGYHAFLNDGTTVRDIGHLGGNYAVANSINDNGIVVGWSHLPDGKRRGFLWDGTMHQLGTLAGRDTEAWAVNNGGVAVGHSINATGKYRAVILSGTTAVDLGSVGYLNATQSFATCVNDKGWVGGYSIDAAGEQHGFIYDGSTVRDLGTIDGGRCFVWGINNAGWIVGSVEKGTSGNYTYKPFLWHPTLGLLDIQSMLDLTGSGWQIQELTDVSNRNVIAGRGRDPNGSPGRAFLLKPANVAQVYANRLYFQTKDQSVWWPGQGRFEFNYFLGPQWNFSKGIGGFFPICFGPWHLWFVTIPAICLGDFGAQLSLASTGRAGLQLQAYADGGSVNLNYPMVVTLQFPDTNIIEGNKPFTVSSSYSTDAAARLSTSSLSAFASLDAVLKADSNAHIKAKAFSKTLLDIEVLPSKLRHVDTGYNFFRTDESLRDGTWHKDFSILDGIVTGHVNIPRLGMAGSANVNGSDPHAIQAKAKDTFFSVNGNITAALSRLLGIPLSVNYTQSFVGGSATIAADLLAAKAGVQVGLSQRLTFSPVPRIRLEFSDGTAPVEFNAGESYQLTMPSDPLLTITPTIWLPNTFNNQTSLVVNGNMTFMPLRVRAEASALGFHLGGFDFVPWSTDLGGNLLTIPLYDRSFDLPGFRPVTLSPITVLGMRAVAPTLTQTSPSSVQLIILPGASPELLDFQGAVSGGTQIEIHGSNFYEGDTQVYFSMHGATDIPLPTEVLSTGIVRVNLPNWFRLLPGTGRFVVTNRYGRSNSLDFSVTYPTPMIGAVIPNLWACDPHLRDVIVSVEPDDNQAPTFIRRLDYYRIVRGFWAQTSSLPTPDAQDYFPQFDFSADAILPVIHWNGIPSDDPLLSGDVLAKYVEPVPSGGLVALLPNASFDRPIPQIPVYIVNPGPGGGPSNIINATVGALTPVVSQVTPNSGQPGDPATRIVVKGPSELEIPGHPNDPKAGNFVATSTVYWNGQPRSTTFVSTSELHADIPAEDLAVGGVNQVTVVTPGIVGTTSNTVSFTVANPLPTIKRSHPQTVITADPSFDRVDPNMSLFGEGFVSNSDVYWNGAKLDASSITFVSDSVMNVKLPAAAVSQPGQIELQVVNPTPGGGASNKLMLTVQNAQPGPTTNPEALWITKLAPSSRALGSTGFDMLVGGSSTSSTTMGAPLGNGFCPGSVVLWNGKPLVTTFNQSSSVAAHVDGSDMAIPGVYNVTVLNPTPGGGTSNVLTFSVSQTGTPIKSFTIAPTYVSGGAKATGKITLAAAAPAAGAVVTISSSEPSAATAPTSVTVPAGATSASFAISSFVTADTRTAVFTATYGGKSRVAALTVFGPRPKSVTFKPTAVTGGSSANTVTGTVTLNAATLVDTPVSITVTGGIDAVDVDSLPSTVIVRAGQTSATFAMKTVVVVASTTVSVTANANGGEVTGKFTVRGPVPISVTFGVNPLKGGKSTDITITLDPTPIADVSVTLVSGNGLVTFNGATSATVTVPAGSATKTFAGLVMAGIPTTNTTVSIKATANGGSKSVNLTVTP